MNDEPVGKSVATRQAAEFRRFVVVQERMYGVWTDSG
jgi:hypothetical protein